MRAKDPSLPLYQNVCYNGPRAGININDGFGGGNVFEGNLVFNMVRLECLAVASRPFIPLVVQVRETGDHGPLNSWDRQPYLTFSGVDE